MTLALAALLVVALANLALLGGAAGAADGCQRDHSRSDGYGGTLGLLAFGGYRGWTAAQTLTELFVGQISLRQEQLDALRRRHFLLSAAMSGIGDAVITADVGGRITFLNPVAEKLTAWQEQDALGREVKARPHPGG